jgi:hypothetical protein
LGNVLQQTFEKGMRASLPHRDLKLIDEAVEKLL